MARAIRVTIGKAIAVIASGGFGQSTFGTAPFGQ